MNAKELKKKFTELGLIQTVEIVKEGTKECIRLINLDNGVQVENIDTGDITNVSKLTKGEKEEFATLLNNHSLNKGAKTDGDWARTYKPQDNHFNTKINPKLAEVNRCMYETCGEEMDFVRQVNESNPKRIWTLFDVDGEWYIRAGLHFMDRVGHFVSEKEWENENEEFFVD